MTRYPDTLVAEVMRETAPKLLATITSIQSHTSKLDLSKITRKA